MLSIGVLQWYINITITILDIIHRPVFYLKRDVSDTGFYLILQEERNQFGPIDVCILSGPDGKWLYTLGSNV
jgi:hypothetical protein